MATTTPIPSRILTPAGWLEGKVQLPEGSSLLEHLNHAGGLLRMADARVEGHEERLPFLAVQRGAMQVVVPEGDASRIVPRAMAEGTSHEVAGVLPMATFVGSVQLAANQRVSDFFSSASGFVVIHGCELWVGAGATISEKAKADLALVHAPSLIAVSDTLT